MSTHVCLPVEQALKQSWMDNTKLCMCALSQRQKGKVREIVIE